MGWQKVKIGSFLKERENRYKPEEANSSGLDRLKKIDFSGNIHIEKNKKTKTGMILVKKGDLVISGINVEKGAVSVYQGEEDVLATIHYSSYMFDEEKIDIGYFIWFLKSKAFRDTVNSQIKSGIKTELKPKRFLPLEIDLPDKDTQIEIRNKLNGVSNEIQETSDIFDKNEKLISKLRQSILADAVSGKLVPQDPKDEPASELLKKIKVEKEKLIQKKKIRKEKPLPEIIEEEKPYELPKGWEWVRLIDILNKLTDGTHHSPPNKPDGEYKYITAKNIKNEGIDLSNITYISKEIHEEIFARCNPEKGDILYIKDGATTGVVTINNLEEPFSLLSSVALLKQSRWLDGRYILWVLKSPVFYEFIRGDMSGAAITRVTLVKMKRAKLPLPPIQEQKRIVEKVDQLMAFCDELEEEVKKSQTNATHLMDAVLREAFGVE